jgi:methyl-accepting chemotaxis protein
MKNKNRKATRVLVIGSILVALMLLPLAATIVCSFIMKGNPAQLGKLIIDASIVLLVYLVVILGVGVFRVIGFSKSVLSTAQEISGDIEVLGRGNFDFIDKTTDTNDETIKTLISFSNQLNAISGDLVNVLNKMAEGDLTADMKVDLIGDWKAIGEAVDAMKGNLNELFTRIKAAAEQTASSSEQVASASQALAQGATEQASAIEELSATVSEISTHARNNASNAANADQASSLAEEKITEASQSMQDMVRAMGQISDASNKISNIIKTIDNIAFQTNILALNAAVEAARAGAAGKGFAVVADEVRNLASKSAEAAKDTTDLIEQAIVAVEEGQKIAHIAEKTLKEVEDASDVSNKLVNEIASASNQQAASIGQITQGLQQISAVVQTNSATAEQSAAASQELAAQAKILKTALASIKMMEAKPEEEIPAEKPEARKEQEPQAKAAFASQAVDDKYL